MSAITAPFVVVAVCPTVLDLDGWAFDKTCVIQALVNPLSGVQTEPLRLHFISDRLSFFAPTEPL